MYILKTTCGISAFVVTCLLSACSDDTFTGNLLTNDEIAFRASVSDRPSGRASRSCGAEGFEYLGPEAVNSDIDQTLYVHTLVNEDYLDKPLSRAAVLEEADFTEFHVSAYAYSGDWIKPGATSQPNLIRSASVKPVEGTSFWSTEGNYYWPATKSNVRFYAYANLPDGVAPSLNQTTLSYTVSPDVTKQNDIIAAVSDVSTATHISSKAPVNMKFMHILTGIKFRTAPGDKALGDYKIKKVSFENVYGKATFSLKEFTADATANRDAMWSIGQGTSRPLPTNFTIDFGDGIKAESDIAITADAQTMMMIPQVLPEGAQVVVTLEDKYGGEHELVKTLAGADWGMGQMITYVISSSAILVEDVFELYKVDRAYATAAPGKETRLPDTYAYTAPYYNYNMYDTILVSMTSHYRIRSYRKEYPKIVDGQVVGAIKTTPLKFTSEGGDSWIELAVNTHKDNIPSEDGAYYDIKAQSQVMKQTDPWSWVLQHRDASEVMPHYSYDESDGYYDLSKRYAKVDKPDEAEVNTSNCYIISAPGKYKFPVVYGNTIRHNKINYEAFGGFLKEGASGHQLSDYEFLTDNPFVTARNRPINEWFEEATVRVDNATTPKLIWSDCPEIVEQMYNSLVSAPNSADSKDEKELVLDDRTLKVKYVYFTIPDSVEQCNMMMGYVSGTSGKDVNWSWHIWVTPFVPNNNGGINDLTNQKYLDEQDHLLSSTSFTANGQDFTLLPYNLGWCNRIYLTFGDKDRSASFTFTQEVTGKELTIDVTQPTTTDIQYGSNLLFQWGRKDPMRGSYSFGKAAPVLKPFFYWNTQTSRVEQYLISVKTNAARIADVLKSPPYIYGASGSLTDWNANPNDYLWRIPPEATPSGTVRQSDGKTMYDPSPVGYLISTSNAFAEFTGNNTLITTPINGIQSDDVYVPLCGYRDERGNLVGGGIEAYYHASDGKGMLYFNSNVHKELGVRKDLKRVISGAVRPRQDRRFTSGE